MNFDVTNLFPVPVYRSKVEITPDIIEAANNTEFTRFESEDGDVSTYHYILKRPEFHVLKEQIEEHIRNYVRKVYCIKEEVPFYITNSWIVKHNFGDSADQHLHWNSIYSGIVYLQCDQDSGQLKFLRTLSGIVMKPNYTELNMYNINEQPYTPEPEDILIFPSSLLHSVTACKSDKPRLCLAFNVFWKGVFGGPGIDTLII